MAKLERAIELAVKYHKGQLDKSGQPYILHPLRMMMSVKGEIDKVVAVLHDIVEDTNFSCDDLRKEGFSDAIISAIDSLTRSEGEDYESYIIRVAQNDLASRVKLVDLEDNINFSRISNQAGKDEQRIKKYKKAKKQILALQSQNSRA